MPDAIAAFDHAKVVLNPLGYFGEVALGNAHVNRPQIPGPGHVKPCTKQRTFACLVIGAHVQSQQRNQSHDTGLEESSKQVRSAANV